MKKRTWLLASAALLTMVVMAACSKPAQNETPAQAKGTYPNAQLLADVKWVEEHLKDANVRIIDTRSKGYENGHIPGAVSLPAGKLRVTERNSLPDEAAFTKLLQEAGVNSNTTLVVYDDAGTGNSATRLFYAAEYFGLKDKVKVLNGGLLAWTSAGKDIETAAPTIAAGSFVAKANPKLITTKEELLKVDAQQCAILDTRSAKEYSGEDLRGNKKGGHIEGAVNKEWSEAINTEATDGIPVFESYESLKAAYAAVGITDVKKTVIPYCQTNIRGAHTYFTLRLLGFQDVRPYEGSWAEWGNDEATPVVK